MNNIRNTRNRDVLLVVLLALLTFAAPRAQAQADEVLKLDIPAQDAGSALLTLAKSSDMQIMLINGAGANAEVEGLKGEYRFEEALAALLTGTGLTYKVAAENFVLVQEPQDEGEENAEEDEEVEEPAAAGAEEPLELSDQTVTGSRLKGGDPTTRVYSFSAEDIAARGVSSLEELFRTLPWSFPTITTQSDQLPGVQFGDDVEEGLDSLGLGTSTINLRALGSANTLVLVNGRRVAGMAGNENSIVNILNMPLAAVERVDIQLDGASAVYGSDAIGGVVNFITRKDYRGLSATFREEFSSTDADRRNMSVNGGYAWGSGNLTATVSRDTSKPINHLKLWTSVDFRPLFGPEFDLRRSSLGQPGVVCEYNGSSQFPGCVWPYMRRQLPAGHSGVGATPDDFTSELARTDEFFPQNGADSTSNSLNLHVEQYITDNLRVYADVLVSDHESYQQFGTVFDNFVVPASNAYNPYGRHVVVSYIPWREIQSGRIPPAHTESENKQRNYNAGFFWEFGGGHQLEISAGRSESRNWAWQIRSHNRRGYYDPTAEKFYEALASSDPAVALNLFGDGTVQGSAFAELFGLVVGPSRGFSDVTHFESLLRGQLFRLWGGPIDYAVGGEFRREVIHKHTEGYAEGGLERDSGPEDNVGVERPTRELSAYFAELAFPIVGPDNARPGLRSLVLSVQARRDTYKSTGVAGGLGAWSSVPAIGYSYVPGEGWQPYEYPDWFQSGTPNIVEVKKGATSPRLGLQYKPTESFTARAAWSRSFKPPSFSELFHKNDASGGMGYFRDPYHPDGRTGFMLYPVYRASFNLDIQPEYSDNFSIGLDWSPERIPGLRWTADWSRVDFTDKITLTNNLIFFEPEIAFMVPEIVQRDVNGYVTLINSLRINLAEKVSEIVDTRLEYAFDTRVGNFTPRLHYTRVLDEFFRITPDSERVDRVGKVGGSDKYRLTGSLTWQKDRIAADLFVYYTPGYENDRTGLCWYPEGSCSRQYASRPTLQVDSLTTVDLTVSYQFDSGLRLRAGGRNIFEADSPTLWGVAAYDPTRWDARARVLFLELNWEM